MDVNVLAQQSVATLVSVAWKVAGAVVLWLVGRWLIRLALRPLERALTQSRARANPAADCRPQRPGISRHPAGGDLVVRDLCRNQDPEIDTGVRL